EGWAGQGSTRACGGRGSMGVVVVGGTVVVVVVDVVVVESEVEVVDGVVVAVGRTAGSKTLRQAMSARANVMPASRRRRTSPITTSSAYKRKARTQRFGPSVRNRRLLCPGACLPVDEHQHDGAEDRQDPSPQT